MLAPLRIVLALLALRRVPGMRRIGDLSFHSMHKDGYYADNEGTSSVHDSHTGITVHHASGTCTDPNHCVSRSLQHALHSAPSVPSASSSRRA